MIKLSAETEALLQARAAAAGRAPDDFLRDALEHVGAAPSRRDVDAARQNLGGAELIARMEAIAERCAARPILDARSAEEIVGYDDLGLPG